MAGEDLRSNVVRRTHGGVCHQSSGSSPVVDLRPVTDSEVDLVNSNRASISRSVGLSLEELLVVVVVVQLVEAGGETKVSQLDMAASVEENVIRLDITAVEVSRDSGRTRICGNRPTYRWMKPNLWTASMASTISAM